MRRKQVASESTSIYFSVAAEGGLQCVLYFRRAFRENCTYLIIIEEIRKPISFIKVLHIVGRVPYA